MSYQKLAESQLLKITDLGELKASGYQPKSIKSELRDNLVKKIREGEEIFPGIWGYEETVIPDLERAILSRHNICLLGLRGQAKSRLARQMVDLLDRYIPVIDGNELNDDPLNPISSSGRKLVAEQGDDTPVSWMSRDQRYTEKLATPDVSIADLIGDVDPIKAASSTWS
jgi:magnesium chelatase subunit I